MSNGLEVVAGDLPRGPASYDSGVFRFRKKVEVGIELATGIQVQGTKTERSFGGAIKDAVSNAASLGPLGLMAGLAFPPAAIPAGIGGAALGALLGLTSGGQHTRSILYVMFADGRTFTALCSNELITLIGSDARTVQTLASRYRAAAVASDPERIVDRQRLPRKWRLPIALPGPDAEVPVEILPPAKSAALPAKADPGFGDHAGRALSAAGDAASVALTNVTGTVAGWMPWRRKGG